MRPVYCFGVNRLSISGPSQLQSLTSFPTIQGGGQYSWFSQDGGVLMFSSNGTVGTFVKLGDYFFVRGSKNSGAEFTDSRLYTLSNYVDITTDFN